MFAYSERLSSFLEQSDRTFLWHYAWSCFPPGSFQAVCVPWGTMRDLSIEAQSDNNWKELFSAYNIQILDSSCCLALFVWNFWHLIRNFSISWSLCLLIHLWSCLSLSRSIPLHFSLNLYIKLRVGNSALRLIYLSHDQIMVNFFVCTFFQCLIY